MLRGSVSSGELVVGRGLGTSRRCADGTRVNRVILLLRAVGVATECRYYIEILCCEIIVR